MTCQSNIHCSIHSQHFAYHGIPDIVIVPLAFAQITNDTNFQGQCNIVASTAPLAMDNPVSFVHTIMNLGRSRVQSPHGAWHWLRWFVFNIT